MKSQIPKWPRGSNGDSKRSDAFRGRGLWSFTAVLNTGHDVEECIPYIGVGHSSIVAPAASRSFAVGEGAMLLCPP